MINRTTLSGAAIRLRRSTSKRNPRAQLRIVRVCREVIWKRAEWKERSVLGASERRAAAAVRPLVEQQPLGRFLDGSCSSLSFTLRRRVRGAPTNTQPAGLASLASLRPRPRRLATDKYSISSL